MPTSDSVFGKILGSSPATGTIRTMATLNFFANTCRFAWQTEQAASPQPGRRFFSARKPAFKTRGRLLGCWLVWLLALVCCVAALPPMASAQPTSPDHTGVSTKANSEDAATSTDTASESRLPKPMPTPLPAGEPSERQGLPDSSRMGTALSGAALYARLQSAGTEILVDGRLQGSGYVASPSGLVVTASHVVWPGETELEVLIHRKGRFPATVVAVDRGHDLALLQLPGRGAPYPWLPLAAANHDLQVLDEIYLFGVPIYRHQVMITGRVARATPTFEYLPEGPFYTRVWHIQADAPRGFSGGPWVNNRGEVVAIQTGYMSQRGVPLGLSFAAPKDAIAHLLTHPTMARTATLGAAFEELWEQPSAVVEKWPKDAMGVLAVDTLSGGPAEKAGLTQDMLIVSAGGQPVVTRQQLLTTIRAHAPGDSLRLTVVLPNGRAQTLSATLGHLEAGFHQDDTTDIHQPQDDDGSLSRADRTPDRSATNRNR